MTEQGDPRHAVEQFLRDQIDTVPHLEALLLLWNSRPKPWSVEDVAEGLFVPPKAAKDVLDDLARLGLIAAASGSAATYHYEPQPDRDRIVDAVHSTYRRELIRVSRLIHSKPSAAVREFARAFRLKKDPK